MTNRSQTRAWSTQLSALLFSCFAVLLIFAGSPAQAFELKPFKDKLFAYPGILESRDGGAYLVVDYDEMRDINRRDQTPERRVRRSYVDLMPRRRQADQIENSRGGFCALQLKTGRQQRRPRQMRSQSIEQHHRFRGHRAFGIVLL